jgi:RimJ/RimL family protein N-acetyltransferase
MDPSAFSLVGIDSVSADVFYNLIHKNKEYIQKGFAGTVKRCQSQEQATQLFSEWNLEEQEKRNFTFFIKEEITGAIIGLLNVKNIDYSVRKCEIGYFISEKYSGKGIVSKCTQKIISYCFEDLNMNKIFLRAAPENIASQKVALKNGFQQEGILRQEYKGLQDKFEDVIYFGLLQNEYNAMENLH